MTKIFFVAISFGAALAVLPAAGQTGYGVKKHAPSTSTFDRGWNHANESKDRARAGAAWVRPPPCPPLRLLRRDFIRLPCFFWQCDFCNQADALVITQLKRVSRYRRSTSLRRSIVARARYATNAGSACRFNKFLNEIGNDPSPAVSVPSRLPFRS